MSAKSESDLYSTPLISLANSIDVVCDQFESQILSDRKPSIRGFLNSFEGSDRAELFSQLLLVEMEYLQSQGESVSKRDYLEVFPEFTAEIEAVDFKYGFGSTVTNDQLETLARSPVPGARVSHFELLERIGSGAAGEVWKAEDLSLGRIVALKVPHQKNISESELRRFRREGTTAAQLRHPNIVSVYEVGRDGHLAFIVTEFVEGSDLREWSERTDLTFEEIAELCAQLAEALQHAHDLGVVHRDLKPANILIDEEGRPHVTDFGLAKNVDDKSLLTMEGQLLGTPAYMSPEQARGDSRNVDRRSDVYSLGMLMYEMLTRSYPFKGTQAAIVNAVMHQDPASPCSVRKDIPRDLETICLRALEKEPGRRYPSAQELAVDLRRFLRGEPIITQRSGVLERSWRWVKRRPSMAAAVFFALIACGSIASAMILADQNRSLLGLRTVTLTTDTPGAKVAFVPLSETTGRRIREKTVFARGTTPVEAELRPGDYFVVAILPDGRFHEVYRHVPKENVHNTGPFDHRSSRVLADGRLQLPGIDIPEDDVIEGMAFLEGKGEFHWTNLNSHLTDEKQKTRVRSFYMDPQEISVVDYRKVSSRMPERLRSMEISTASSLSLNYDAALTCAERLGKRLPSEIEYLFAATDRGSSHFPWGDEFPQDKSYQESHSMPTAPSDALNTEPAIVGLCSGKAEWTTSWAIPESGERVPEISGIDVITSHDYRAVRGGDYSTIRGDNSFTPEKRDPRLRISINRHRTEPGLGFRCVRSLEPYIAYEEFPEGF